MRLEARDLAFGYPRAPVGRGVNLQVEAGEVLCLLGPNGSGKTTLFKTLLGLLPKQGGAVEIGGRDLADMSRAEIARSIGYAPQAHAAFFPFSVREIVLMGRAARVGAFASPSKHDHAFVDAVLEQLGIGRLAQRAYTEISGGERQMTLIARALAQEPSILMLDEPTANLDFGNQARALACVSGLAKTGLAIVLSTHDPDHALAYGSCAALMADGALIAAGPPLETVTSATLKQLYGIDVAVTYVAEQDRHVCIPSIAGGSARA